MSATSNDLSHVRFISAGAGSGKTYRLTQELERALVSGTATPAGVIGTTFTVKAASDIRDRVRLRLIESGRPLLAEQMAQALIGTVHSVCQRLLNRFAFELGISPELNVASSEDGGRLFNQALDEVLDTDQVRQMNQYAARLGLRDERNDRSWHDHVKAVADEARSNNIAADALKAMGRESADQFLGFFPAISCSEEASAALHAAIQGAIAAIDLTTDTTKGTASYVAELRVADADLARNNCPWLRWISLSKKAPTKKSEAAALPVKAAAARYDCHAAFHGDIRGYVEGVFMIAAAALDRFQAIKTERGLIDYNDMEQFALRALDEPAVVDILRDELDLLLVDEFQDTNPIQLGIFMKLARLAREVVFVGDIKQSIYGFRGADPDLVSRTLDALTARGCTLDVLKRSWRSRPSLVRYLNAVFTTAFERDDMARNLVELMPEREEMHDAAAVAHWTLPKGKVAEQADTVAAAVADLVHSGRPVCDPATGKARAVTWGDVAVLAATNSHVALIANALRKLRIPMKMSLAGLLEVPEACLAKACLRRLNDPSDTLATAEIRALGACEEPEVWLADRLRWLANHNDHQRWGEADVPIVAELAVLREQTATQSPVEIVARVLNYVGIRPIVTAWGPDAARAAQRQQNLDALLELAVEYEDHCASQHEAATLTGFLFWLESPSSPALDEQPAVTGGDAVHVLTYHRAKGLEWPVIVATDFHYAWPSRLWGVRAESTSTTFDADNPLAGRTIRFYPNVFGRNTTNVPVLNTIMSSSEARAVAATGDAELRRLAYVGMTRARDTVIIAVPSAAPKQDAWIRTFDSEHLLPRNNRLATPEGDAIPVDCRDLATAHFTAPVPPPFTPTWFLERTPTAAPLRERLSPSEAQPVEGATVGERIEIGPRIAVRGDVMTAIGTALHAIIAAEFVNPGRDDALEHAASLIHALALDGAVAPVDAIECTRRLRAVIDERFAPRRMLVEHPVELVQDNGQVLRGWIDLLLETDTGWVVIDHKSSPRPRTEWDADAIEYSGQLAAYAGAIKGAGLVFAGCWVHFPVTGGLVEVVCV